MAQKFLRPASVVGFLVIAALLVAVCLFPTKPPAPPPLPDPNGYKDFVKAGEMLKDTMGDPAAMDKEALRAAVASNAPALHLARVGFQRECYALTALAPTRSGLRQHLLLTALQSLEMGFFAEGKLAERESRPGDAARAFLDVIRLGHELPRGGLAFDREVGVDCESTGCRALHEVVGQLSASECSAALLSLETLDSPAEPEHEIAKRQRSFTFRALGFREHTADLIGLLRQQRFAELFAILRRKEKWEERLLSQAATLQTTKRLLMVDLAARAYELEKGQPPKTVDDLVPAYLKVIPKDPVTGTNLVLTPLVPATR